jgi:hypothetical protein
VPGSHNKAARYLPIKIDSISNIEPNTAGSMFFFALAMLPSQEEKLLGDRNKDPVRVRLRGRKSSTAAEDYWFVM